MKISAYIPSFNNRTTVPKVIASIRAQTVPVDELFEVVIDSSHAGVRKPDPRIFRLALDALDVTPEQSLFLDDFPGNVAAANTLGMRGILVGTDRLAAIAELDALLGEA